MNTAEYIQEAEDAFDRARTLKRELLAPFQSDKARQDNADALYREIAYGTLAASIAKTKMMAGLR